MKPQTTKLPTKEMSQFKVERGLDGSVSLIVDQDTLSDENGKISIELQNFGENLPRVLFNDNKLIFVGT